ncbi:LysR family transcriptional regulator [Pseudoroseicyclus sp. CXY001]|uniref:LysR family transcriptional regulator n=1 Tax=Pseudoroseicyclus sp. CXY001 TaxID=3242492 RepID=UPI00357104F5
MDWRNIGFDWTRVRAFLVTAEEGSLSAAARALGLAQPTLGRQVDALEEELGVVLFERVGRGLRLTPAGHALIAHAREMGAAASRLSMAAYGQNAGMEGRVTISVSEVYAGLVLPPILARLHAAEPRIEIELVATMGVSDLLSREADIAIRNVRPTEPDLVARKIRDATARLYGARALLESLGPVATPHDLARAPYVAIGEPELLASLLNRQGVGLGPANFPYRTDNMLVMWEMVKQGLGLGVIDCGIGDAEPRVARALEALEPVAYPVWLVAHRDIHNSRRLRFVYDFFAEALR